MLDESSRDRTQEASEAYVKLLTGEQMNLLYYLTRILGDPQAAENVLQETNLVLWRKVGEFTMGTDFSKWARSIAIWQARAYVRDRNRDRHVFSEDLITQLSIRESHDAVESDARVALRECLKNIRDTNLEILRYRYEFGLRATVIAERVGRTETAIRALLLRMRKTLQGCIEAKLSRS